VRARPALALVLLSAGLLAGAACSSSDADTPTTGPAIYKEFCQTCHGRTGGGFVGPSLVDIAARYPDVADQVSVVARGQAQMPGFASILSTRQIEKVVEYTRTEFSTSPTTTTGPTVGPTLPSDTG
jgi:mono/diheme cytochrome c family protein